MIRRARRNGGLRLLAGGVLAATWCCIGCQSPGSGGVGPGRSAIDPTRVDTRDDIVQVIEYWPQLPWLQDSNRIIGFRVPVYFVSGQTEKGAFVPGQIMVWLYVREPTADGRRAQKLAHVWEFDQNEALGFRVTKRAIGGYYYGFPLRWPQELALEGQRVEIQFGYERQDKRVVLGPMREFLVPVPEGYEPPTTQTEH